MSSTGISWVVNPDGTPGRVLEVSAGCTKVSRGCDNCWACRLIATRHAHLANWHEWVKSGGADDKMRQDTAK